MCHRHWSSIFIVGIFWTSQTHSKIAASIGPLMGGCPCLLSILRMAACPVLLEQSPCHCITNERTRNLVNYTVSNVAFHWICIAAYLHSIWEFIVQTHRSLTMLHETRPPTPKSFLEKENDTPHLSIFVSVRLVSSVADNKGIVSRVASMACRMSILRLWRVVVSNLRIAWVAVSNLGICGPKHTQPSSWLSRC